MTLVELQKILGERIAIAQNKELSREEREEESHVSDGIVKIAKQMINNADIILRTDKLIAEGRIAEDSIISKIVSDEFTGCETESERIENESNS